MIKRITKKEALDHGFTHHGSYFGIPMWMTDSESPLVTVKFSCMNVVFDMADQIEGFLFGVFWPNDIRVTTFKIGREIDDGRL